MAEPLSPSQGSPSLASTQVRGRRCWLGLTCRATQMNVQSELLLTEQVIRQRFLARAMKDSHKLLPPSFALHSIEFHLAVCRCGAKTRSREGHSGSCVDSRGSKRFQPPRRHDAATLTRYDELVGSIIAQAHANAPWMGQARRFRVVIGHDMLASQRGVDCG
ncbi:hypothetical protein LZ32DRAFT_285893 [Colletotrichum eremochloae]|nr:hypothetical protein LZ32DRAFT_285893 [Colletotrichum eremochloae]